MDTYKCITQKEMERITNEKNNLAQELQRIIDVTAERIELKDLKEKYNADKDKMCNLERTNQALNFECFVTVAIEIGACCSGVAFGFRNTDIFDRSNQITPTALLLDANKNFKYFGNDAEKYFQSLAAEQKDDDWYFLRNFKLMLAISKSNSSELLLHTYDRKKTVPAVLVYSLAIQYFRNCIIQLLKNAVDSIRDDEIRWILTYPPAANLRFQQILLEAAEKAGLKRDRLILLSEPKANFWNYQNPQGLMDDEKIVSTLLQPGRKCMIVNCGSGSLDVTAYGIGNDLTLEEMYNASFTATSFTDAQDYFKQLIIKLVGSVVFLRFCNVAAQEANYLFMDFNRALAGFPEDGRHVNLHIRADLSKLFEDETEESLAESIRQNGHYPNFQFLPGNVLRLSRTLIERCMEYPVYNIVCKISHVLRQPELRDISSIILTGWFAECPCLISKIRHALPGKTIIQPRNNDRSVLKGAVKYGRNHHNM